MTGRACAIAYYYVSVPNHLTESPAHCGLGLLQVSSQSPPQPPGIYLCDGHGSQPSMEEWASPPYTRSDTLRSAPLWLGPGTRSAPAQTSCVRTSLLAESMQHIAKCLPVVTNPSDDFPVNVASDAAGGRRETFTNLFTVKRLQETLTPE